MGENVCFRSILDLHDNPDKNALGLEFVSDLNLDRIIDQIEFYWGEKVRTYQYFPIDKESEDYRREVYRDIRGARLFSVLRDFLDGMRNVLEFDSDRKQCLIGLQSAVWNINEAAEYTGIILKLKADLRKAEENGSLKSEGLKLLLQYLEEYSSSEGFLKMASEADEIQKELSEIEIGLQYGNNRIDVTVQKNGNTAKKTGREKCSTEGSSEEKAENASLEGLLRSLWPDNPAKLVTPFDETGELLLLEQEILRLMIKSEPKLFKAVEEFDKVYREYISPELTRLAEELPFYLSFYRFEEEMEQRGFYFSIPTAQASEKMSAEGLYDLALACTRESASVVANSFSYEDGEQFFVLTGPNQGGKTTFARSLGQLVYFGKMGLEVPARGANLHYYDEILTHFSVEESVETGRGKLKEELMRLAPMMKKEQKGVSFVIINELFTTAANYDAVIMGTNVLRHFIGRGCYGIYVTHLRELCDADVHVSGLSAMLDEKGHQNFKISRENMEYADCAANQVAKHRLGYEQLVERLADRLKG